MAAQKAQVGVALIDNSHASLEKGMAFVGLLGSSFHIYRYIERLI